MPIDRDEHDERLARIEQMLEQLDRESKRFQGFEPDERASVLAAKQHLRDAIEATRRARIISERRRANRTKKR